MRHRQTFVRRNVIACFAVVFPFVLLLMSNAQTTIEGTAEPYRFFREYAGLNDDQIHAIQGGKPIAKVLPSRTPDEVFVFGTVYVRSTPERYLKFASDVDALRKLSNYIAIEKFSDPPKLSDLDGFSLDENDIQELKDCKPGHCQIQLPTEAIETFQQSVDWSAADRADQINRLARQMTLECLQRYIQGGNRALGTYRDKEHPTEIGETFQSLLSWSKALPVYLPDLRSYLLEYPNAKSDVVQSQFYWEKVNFGLKPTLRVVQSIAYRGKTSYGEPAYAVAEKQLYASHYFETALDLTVCVKDARRPDEKGFYLITLKGSKQAGLTGIKGSIVRKVAVDKTRSSLERGLVSLKIKLEEESQ